jgi:hypothetical protein
VEASTAKPPRLSFVRVYGSSLSMLAYNWFLLLPIAIVLVLVPVAIELLYEHELPTVWAGLLTSFLDTLATVIFAGLAEEAVHRWEEGERRVKLRPVLAKVPAVIVPLFVVGLLQAVAVAVGLVLLVIPGLIAATLTAVAGPVVVAERSGIRGAFRRSFRLVRGNAWRVFAVIVSIELLAAVIGAIVGAVFGAFGEQPQAPVSLAIGEGLTLPLEGLLVPMMYWRLRELRTQEEPATST